MSKEKAYLIATTIFTYLLIVCAILADSTPLAIVAGAFAVADQIQQKEMSPKITLNAESISVSGKEKK